jgi:nuclear pore complex protein Nup205
MWITSRSLYHQLTRVLTELDNESLSEELVKNLRDNIQHITKPLTNKPKNASQRNLLEPTKTVILANGQKFVLNQVISDEAKILSDLFDVNEIDAVELILTGELQTRNFNTLPRGLCAVVCYYEAHRHFILILKMLLRLKSVADDMMPTILVEFVDSLLKDKELFKRVLYILQNFNVKSEFEKLQKPTVNGLGTVEHQRALMECIEDIEKSCYEILCIFCHNSLIELQAEILDLLFTALRAVPLEQDSLRFSTANLAIWTSILVFINPSRLKHSQNIQQIFEIFRKNLYEKWNNPTCCASIAFCFSIAVRCSRNYPGGFRNQIPLEESKLLDTALDNCALQFIRSCIIDVRDYASFEVTVDIIDSFIKSFLCYFQDKNQELFNICEDELSGINETDEDYIKKPNLYYLKFLDMVTHAYSADSSKVASLCEQFTLSKYTPLVNFLTNARSIASPRLFIPYIEMIKTFCKTERIAQFVFEIFTGDERSMLSWDRLFSGLSQYLNDFNGKQRQLNWQTKPSTLPQKIGTTELAGILTFLRLAKIVAEKSDNARLGFYGSHKLATFEESADYA